MTSPTPSATPGVVPFHMAARRRGRPRRDPQIVEILRRYQDPCTYYQILDLCKQRTAERLLLTAASPGARKALERRYEKLLRNVLACPPEAKPCRCAERQAGAATCGCPPQFTKCRHVLRMEEEIDDNPELFPFTVDEADVLLRAYYPEDYDDPPPPPAPALRLTKQQELDVFNARAAVVRSNGQPTYALRHPADVLPGQVDTLSVQGLPRLRGGDIRPSRRAA